MNPVHVGIALGALAWTAHAEPGKPSVSADSNTMSTLNSPKPHAVPRFITEHAELVAGKTNYLGVTFDIERNWHLYWRGQNVAGMPPNINLELPAGFTAGEIQWPAPKREVLPGEILNYVYYDRLTLLIPVSVPASAAGQTVTIKAAMDWLVCEDGCVLEEKNIELRVPVRTGGAEKTPVESNETKPAYVETKRFEETRAALPKAVAANDKSVKIDSKGSSVRLQVDGAKRVEFYPDMGGIEIRNAITGGSADQSALTLECEEPDGAKELRGIVCVVREGAKGPEWLEIKHPLPKLSK